MMKTTKDKILGCLVGAATGDAMGAATECRSTLQILEHFGGYVTEFKDPPQDTFARSNSAGMCTDDFIQGFYILEAVLDNNGVVDFAAMKKAFQKWFAHPYSMDFTGPTTKAAMKEILAEQHVSLQHNSEAQELAPAIVNDANSKATNGAAMKIYPAGLLNPGHIEKAISDAIKIAKFTHNNSLAISGACAVAAAISEALSESSSFDSICHAALYAAEKGYVLACNSDATQIAGASVAARIPLALSIGKKYQEWSESLKELADIIGNGLHVSEAVPAAFGCIAASNNNALKAIYAAVNIGNDTDTIATMAGAIMGAYQGMLYFSANELHILNQKNNFSLGDTADRIVQYLL